jgi:hypothetical protein
LAERTAAKTLASGRRSDANGIMVGRRILSVTDDFRGFSDAAREEVTRAGTGD